MDNPLTRLHQFIVDHYDLEEFRTLCFNLGVNYHELAGETLSGKARELILKMGRKRKLDRLLHALRQNHPELLDQAGLSTDPAPLYDALPDFRVMARHESSHRNLRSVITGFVDGFLKKCQDFLNSLLRWVISNRQLVFGLLLLLVMAILLWSLRERVQRLRETVTERDNEIALGYATQTAQAEEITVVESSLIARDRELALAQTTQIARATQVVAIESTRDAQATKIAVHESTPESTPILLPSVSMLSLSYKVDDYDPRLVDLRKADSSGIPAYAGGFLQFFDLWVSISKDAPECVVWAQIHDDRGLLNVVGVTAEPVSLRAPYAKLGDVTIEKHKDPQVPYAWHVPHGWTDLYVALVTSCDGNVVDVNSTQIHLDANGTAWLLDPPYASFASIEYVVNEGQARALDVREAIETGLGVGPGDEVAFREIWYRANADGTASDVQVKAHFTPRVCDQDTVKATPINAIQEGIHKIAGSEVPSLIIPEDCDTLVLKLSRSDGVIMDELKFPLAPPVVIDSMDTIIGRNTYTGTQGSSISVGLVDARTNTANEIAFDLPREGWVGLWRPIKPDALSGVKRIRFFCRGLGQPNTIELKLIYEPDNEGESAVFSVSWSRATAAQEWTILGAYVDEFYCWVETGCQPDEVLDLDKVWKMDFALSNKEGDTPGRGTVIIDDVQGIK